MADRETGPPECEERAPATETRPHHDHQADSPDGSRSCRRCASGTACVCGFYRDWRAGPSRSQHDPIPMQLRRRREASLRCVRLDSGLREPISRSYR